MNAKMKAILEDQEAEDFDDLVKEYAAMGYSEFATARRLLGIDVRTMRNYLSEPVEFKRHASGWQDYADTAAKVLEARKASGKLRLITHKGETHHLREWARRTGIAYTTIARRIDQYGWDVARALTAGESRKGAHRPHKCKPTDAQRIDFSNPTNGYVHYR